MSYTSQYIILVYTTAKRIQANVVLCIYVCFMYVVLKKNKTNTALSACLMNTNTKRSQKYTVRILKKTTYPCGGDDT